jgi:hypothetical protein
MTKSNRQGMLAHLAKLQALRGDGVRDELFAARLLAVKRWQSERLARTYADLASQERYALAVDFFLNDLYGPKDFAQRDAEMIRIYPTMVKLLPLSTVETVELALELDALSEQLDQQLTTQLFAKHSEFSEANYIEAFRDCGTKAQRMRQVELVEQVGERLDLVVDKPLIHSTLRLLRRPARLTGLGELQDFLERGFAAFRHMHGAHDFLATIAARESEIVRRIFSRHPSPFSL